MKNKKQKRVTGTILWNGRPEKIMYLTDEDAEICRACECCIEVCGVPACWMRDFKNCDILKK